MNSQTNVLTNRGDNARSSVNASETALRPDTVSVRRFGKLFGRTVDGDIYAQPLVVANVRVDGRYEPVDIVVVATASNSIYCFDAVHPLRSTPYWHVGPDRLGQPVKRDVVYPPNLKDFETTIGITSTPVIDLESATLYVSVKSMQRNGVCAQRLHALHLANGHERADFNSPVTIAAQVPGTGHGNVNGTIVFNPTIQLNRPGLLLHQGRLFLAFGSHGDQGDYHGWVLAYDARSLAQTGVYCDTPNGKASGIWHSGTGLSAIDGSPYVYFVAGNGDPNGGGNANFVGQLDTTAGVQLRSAFVPPDAGLLDVLDLDLSTAPVLLPGNQELIACSKQGKGYVLETRGLGHVTTFQASTKYEEQLNPLIFSNVHGAPVCWKKPDGRIRIFVWGEFGRLAAFERNGGCFVPVQHSTMPAPCGMPGAMMTLSSSGSEAETAVLWASHPYTSIANSRHAADANTGTVDGILRAFDPADVTRELWNSEQAPSRDRVGKFAKFCTPTVANGRVYLATFADPQTGSPANELAVYGLLHREETKLAPEDTHWEQADVGTPIVGNYSRAYSRIIVTSAGADIWGCRDEFHFVFRRRSGDCTIVARVRSVEWTNDWAKAGVMIRTSLEPDAPHAMMVVTPKHGAAFQRRYADGKLTWHTGSGGFGPGSWVKLNRSGNLLSGYLSRDGKQWQRVGWMRLHDADMVFAGLVVTSHTGRAVEPHPMNTSSFDGVSEG